MALTPADVANKLFGKQLRGYAMEEVDSFLDEVEAELTRLLTENASLRGGAPVPPPPAEPPAAPPAAPPAPVAPGEPQEAALRTLLMAQRTADQAVAEARAEADLMLAQARERSAQVEQEVQARTAAALAELDARRTELERRIDDLRAFEREYRVRLKAYLESQLRDLDSRGGGGADDAGTGVPAAARTAAVGLTPPGVVAEAAAQPAAPPPGPPGAGVHPGPQASPPIPVPGAAPGPAPSPAPPAATAPASTTVVPGSPPPPAGPPREAGPVGPFQPPPPALRVEQVDEGPEPQDHR